MAKDKKGSKTPIHSDVTVTLLDESGVDSFGEEVSDTPVALNGQNVFYYSDGSTSDSYDRAKALHREDGPAIERNDGTKEWYANKRRHRMDGPAIEFANGDKYWFIDGIRYTEEDYKLVGGR